MTHSIVIQYKLSNNQVGSSDELEFRHEMEDWLGGVLQDPRYGVVDGGQNGAGAMEIFIYQVAVLDDTLRILMQALTDAEYLHMCKVVSVEDREGFYEDEDWVVHYPEGAHFSMWEW